MAARHDQRAHMREEPGLRAYRALYEYCPDGVLFTIPDGTILAANPAACRLLGLTEAEIRRRGRKGLADPIDERWRELVAERDGAGSAHGVARMLRGDGTPIEIEMSSQLFTEDDGQPRTCTVIRDVTAREQLERELLASRAQLAEAERIARVGSWQWDIATDSIRWSDGMAHLYGLDPHGLTQESEARLERVHPDDRARVTQTIERALGRRSSFSLDYRGITVDGHVRLFHADGQVIVGPDGQPTRMTGVIQDITEAVHTRDALRRASDDFERHAAELQRLATTTRDHRSPERPPLTPRQLEVLQLIADGLTTKQIADRLVVTPAAVKWHVREILARTGTTSRAQAVAALLRYQQDQGGHDLDR